MCSFYVEYSTWNNKRVSSSHPKSQLWGSVFQFSYKSGFNLLIYWCAICFSISALMWQYDSHLSRKCKPSVIHVDTYDSYIIFNANLSSLSCVKNTWASVSHNTMMLGAEVSPKLWNPSVNIIERKHHSKWCTKKMKIGEF